ncbi:uncharacterized protein T551_03104 [Pneumocystis jirovecii RU7]|uniref:Major surface glycoprotein 2 C-terminal domain-containing protein n=1 Tax=Pneumocystis jirovecii (strain RU7) TaxID=1408657 RepID=A0A0W4ZGX4_PNEJ7|nr:uncharacterized protein T551_03104 [Pneumocystis jirovecii RU7]KTW27605.1 hypothetical protein T551_03104 [Pneumocystis jirovecii RU7]
MFFKGICSSEFKKKCIELREKCRKKRNELTEKILLRAFAGNLKTEKDCNEVINERCFLLMEESDELMSFCLIESDKSNKLINIMKSQCNELELIVVYCLKNSQCTILKEKCIQKTDYILPNSTFNPIGKEVALMEKVRKKELFKNEIGKPKIKDMDDLLILIVNNNINECEVRLEECYKFCSFLPQLKDLYDNVTEKMSESKKEICTSLKNKLKLKFRVFKSKLNNLSLSYTSDDNKDAILLRWFEQFAELNERLCTNLESKCLYLQKPCNLEKIKLGNACSNAILAYLKMRIFKKEYKIFESNLKRKLRNLEINSSLDTCINELFDLCKKEIGIRKPILASLCLWLKSTCQILTNDIERQSWEFRTDLDLKRDFSEEDCKELKEKCEILGQDSKINELSCLILERYCDHMKNAKELEDILLEEKTEKLDDFNSCIERVSEKCNNCSGKRKAKFILPCIELNTTCKIMTKDIKFKCSALKRNINIKVQYLVRDNKKDGKCKELKENCKSYRIIQNQEMELMYELKGNLDSKDKCKSALNKYCIRWNEMKNTTFVNLCSDNTDTKNDIAISGLCEKLIKRMEKRCADLSIKLSNIAIEIED